MANMGVIYLHNIDGILNINDQVLQGRVARNQDFKSCERCYVEQPDLTFRGNQKN